MGGGLGEDFRHHALWARWRLGISKAELLQGGYQLSAVGSKRLVVVEQQAPKPNYKSVAAA